MKHRIPHLVFAILACAFLFGGCNKRKSETNLLTQFRKMDSYLRTSQFRYDSMKMYEEKIAENFAHAVTKELSYEERKATVDYLWNSDSSLVLVNAHKKFRKGFNREVIVHAGDSILFIHRFSTEPLGLESREDFTFLEAILYVTPTGTIKHLARISYRQENLKDTVAFRRKPFADLADKISFYYALELNHSRNILTLN